MKVAYDLDGVLAVAPAPNVKKWGLMKGPERVARVAALEEHYRTVTRILNPQERFSVISARKESTRAVTEDWLRQQYGERVIKVWLLSVARSVENVVEFKSGILNNFGFQKFTEDNLPVLRAIARRTPRCNCFYFDGAKIIAMNHQGVLCE